MIPLPIDNLAATLEGAALADEEIVQRVRGGETALFEIIMRRHNQRIYRVIRGILGHDAETEDALQDTYLNAFTHLATFRGESKLATWLTRIAVHEAMRRKTRNRHMRSLHGLADDGGDSRRPEARDPAHFFEESELRTILTQSIDQLPEPLRAVMVLRDVEGLDTRETAECLGISEANARVQLHRAREMLRTDIDRRLSEETRMVYQFGAERCDRVVASVMEQIVSRLHSTS